MKSSFRKNKFKCSSEASFCNICTRAHIISHILGIIVPAKQLHTKASMGTSFSGNPFQSRIKFVNILAKELVEPALAHNTPECPPTLWTAVDHIYTKFSGTTILMTTNACAFANLWLANLNRNCVMYPSAIGAKCLWHMHLPCTVTMLWCCVLLLV